MKLGCVVLAAGQGRRFGDNKLLQVLGDRPVLGHVLSALPRKRFVRVVVVASSQGVEALCNERGFACLRYPGGPQSESIRRGIGAMDGLDGCLFVMGDQPLCTRASMGKILDAFLAHPEAVVRLAWGETPCSPVLFPASYFTALKSLNGEQGGMAAVKSLGAEIRLVQAGDEAELWDVDTPADLEKIAMMRKKTCQK